MICPLPKDQIISRLKGEKQYCMYTLGIFFRFILPRHRNKKMYDWSVKNAKEKLFTLCIQQQNFCTYDLQKTGNRYGEMSIKSRCKTQKTSDIFLDWQTKVLIRISIFIVIFFHPSLVQNNSNLLSFIFSTRVSSDLLRSFFLSYYI